jgi:hypothetical protein
MKYSRIRKKHKNQKLICKLTKKKMMKKKSNKNKKRKNKRKINKSKNKKFKTDGKLRTQSIESDHLIFNE